MNWLWAALAPHPPIIVPEVGRGREKEAEKTLIGMAALQKFLGTDEEFFPDCLLLLSPHAPYTPGSMFFNSAENMHGSLSAFRAAEVKVELKSNPASLRALSSHLKACGIPVADGVIEDITRDHGTIVPLYFLKKVWGKLPELIIANPCGLTLDDSYRLGEALASFDDGKSWGLLASGDLSHRLTPDAPAGYNPAGKILDNAIVESLKNGNPEAIRKLSSRKIEDAAECGLRPAMTLLGLAKAPLEVFSYEGPFGVGYCTAAIKLKGANKSGFSETGTKSTVNKKPDSIPAGFDKEIRMAHPFPSVARKAINAYFKSGKAEEENYSDIEGLCTQEEKSLLDSRKACFVTIKTASDELRGCIGTIVPVRVSLLKEIIANAVSAATGDPRFPVMRQDELEQCKISVDVLTEPEPVRSLSQLDPKKYGVIVSTKNSRGLLLPDLEGVDSVDHQLAIAAQKGGISDLSKASIFRFRVERFLEKED